MTHILQGDDVGMLSISQQDLHLLRRIFLSLADDLWKDSDQLTSGVALRNMWLPGLYLDSVLHARSFVQAAFTDGIGPDSNVLFDFIGV